MLRPVIFLVLDKTLEEDSEPACLPPPPTGAIVLLALVAILAIAGAIGRLAGSTASAPARTSHAAAWTCWSADVNYCKAVRLAR